MKYFDFEMLYLNYTTWMRKKIYVYLYYCLEKKPKGESVTMYIDRKVVCASA